MEIGNSVTLNQAEQYFCKVIAKKRHDSNRSNNVKNSKIGSQSDLDTDLNGFCAEMCFAKIFNLYPDFSVEPRNKETDNGDLTLHNGMTVDVKATVYDTGRLLVAKWKKPVKNRLYALMVGKFPTFEYRGIMTSEDLIVPERLRLFNNNYSYVADQNELIELFDWQL